MGSRSDTEKHGFLPVVLRDCPRQSDTQDVPRLLQSSGIFYPFEIAVAAELIDDRLLKGQKSEYFFLFAECGDELAGYICYGPISMTDRRYDIYWIAVRDDMKGRGIGSAILAEAVGRIRAEGGARIFVETSSRSEYVPARKLYDKAGFHEVARIPFFYADNDDKVIFVKVL